MISQLHDELQIEEMETAGAARGSQVGTIFLKAK